MAGVDEVVGLLRELRDSQGMLGRASVLARGAAAMRQLTAQQKRELAVQVAERAAPQLVPRIEAETGLDLTPAQVSAVMDLALRMDRDDLDDLIATIESPEARGQVGREVLGAVGRELDEELDLGILPPPPPALLEEDQEDEGDEPREPVSTSPVDDAPVADAPPTPDDVVDDEELAELRAELEATRREVAELEQFESAVAEDVRHLVDGLADGPVAPAAEDLDDEPTQGDTADDTEQEAEGVAAAAALTIPAAAAAQVEALHDLATDPGSTEASPARSSTPDGPDGSNGSAADRDHQRELARAAIARIHRASSAGTALRAVTRDAGLLWDAGVDGRAEAVRAVPDGWARRRALQRLVEAGVVTPGEAPALVRLLDRESDRTWVLGTMLDDDLIGTDDLDGLIGARASERLARRG